MLYIVATPIGNLEDITLRAIRTLKEADLILCEDTRVTATLLRKYEIATPMAVFHANTAPGKIEVYLSMLEGGKDIALVTDAGTPGISDPGVLLVMKAKERGIESVAIPGASALTTAISSAGIPMHEFVFLGFLPQKKGRETLIKEIAASKRPTVLYESPHKIEKLLASFAKAGIERVHLARELTKKFEERLEGSPEELLSHFAAKPPKGEFVVIVW